MNQQRQRLEFTMILMICLEPKLIEQCTVDQFTGLARDAFLELQAAVGEEESIGFENLHRLLRDHYGIVRRNGEKVKDAVKRVLELEAEARRLRSEYLKKRMELGKRT